MAVSISLLKYLARRFKYRELPDLIGKQVTIHSLDSVISDLQPILKNSLLEKSSLLVPERKFFELGMAKYGILDLTFSATNDLFDQQTKSGIWLLKELHFLPNKKTREQLQELTKHWDDQFSDDPTCLIELKDDIETESVVTRLFLESLRSEGDRHKPRLTLPDDYLPRVFVVKDAAVTNAAFCWFHKHFYF